APPYCKSSRMPGVTTYSRCCTPAEADLSAELAATLSAAGALRQATSGNSANKQTNSMLERNARCIGFSFFNLGLVRHQGLVWALVCHWLCQCEPSYSLKTKHWQSQWRTNQI